MTAPASPPTVKRERNGRYPKGTNGGAHGKKGRSGRKSKDFLARCIEATQDDGLWQEAREKNPNSVLGLAASYAHGLPKQSTEHTGELKIVVEYVKG